jgi:hypothetical protein
LAAVVYLAGREVVRFFCLESQVIIDDSTAEAVWSTGPTGLDMSERPNIGGYGYGSLAQPFPRALRVLTKQEIIDISREQTKYKTRVSDFREWRAWAVKNQGQTNYCWANATVYALELQLLKQGQPVVPLSPASVAAPIKGYRNQGGWGADALKWLRTRGAVPVEYWPANAIDRRFATEANELRASKYRCTDWVEIAPRNMLQAATVILMGHPISAGFNWWGHQVTLLDVVIRDGEIGWRIANSWGPSWGDGGIGELHGSKAVFDDGVCPVAGSLQ